MEPMKQFLKISGDYTNWNVYRKSLIVCDVTEMFIRRYSLRLTRTADQMRQAARSCKQNLVEGITDATVSLEMGIRLVGIARGSARELLEDYGDYLRQNRLVTWGSSDIRALQARYYCRLYDDPAQFVGKCTLRTDETVANIMLTQLHQLDHMLGAVLRKMEEAFISQGGIKEQMSQVRRDWRRRNGGQ